MPDAHVRARDVFIAYGATTKSVHNYGPYWNMGIIFPKNPAREHRPILRPRYI